MTLTLTDIPFTDPATLKLLGDGRTVGVFQVEGKGMQRLLQKVKPTEFYDLSAVLALYRPGPMGADSHNEFARRKNSGQARPSIHPSIDGVLEDLLSETYGLIVYQEQVMRILARVTGWTGAEANDIFDAMRKKDTEKMLRGRPLFMEAGESQGHSIEALGSLWDILVPFSDYSFNKAHSLGYAVISWWSAYLKANHPKEYMTALLTSAKPEDTARYLAETKEMGISLLPPDINESGMGFTRTQEGIRYGLGAIKGLGEASTTAILSGRPYRSLDGFFRNADAKVLHRGTLEPLIKSGCLDSLWGSRESLLAEAVELSRLALDRRSAKRTGQGTLTGTRYVPKARQTPKDRELRSTWERELLGAVLSHPRIILRPQRPLGEAEWVWLRGLLRNGEAVQRVTIMFGRVEMELPKATYSAKLVEQLRLIEVEAEEE